MPCSGYVDIRDRAAVMKNLGVRIYKGSSQLEPLTADIIR